MANSGSFNTNAYKVRYLKFSWSVVSQSVEKNQTVISWSLKGAGGNSTSWYIAGNFKAMINGITVYSSASRIKLYNGTTVASGRHTINHNNDGNKWFEAYAEAGIYTHAVNSQGRSGWNLPTIARATNPNTNKTTVYFGDVIRINLPRASSSFTHKIQAGVDGNFTDIATNVGAYYDWTIPKRWARYIKTDSKKIRIRALTYSNGTYVGMKEVLPYITVKATYDMAPVVSISLSDPKGFYENYGGFVKGQSKIRARVTEELYEGTKVKSRTLVLNGVTYQSSDQTSNVINSLTQNVVAKVTDQRNKTGEKTITARVYDWYSPKIENHSISRCTEDGQLDDSGYFIRVDYNIQIADVNNKNTKALKIGYKKQSISSWSYKNITLSDYQSSGHIIIPADGEFSWDVKIELTDAFATTKIEEIIGTVYVLMDFHKSGKGIAIGKVSESKNTVEINQDWDLKVYGRLLLDALHPIGSIYITVNTDNPSVYFGGVWERFAQGKMLYSCFDNPGATGGSNISGSHTLTINEIPTHSHKVKGSTHSGGKHTHGYPTPRYWYAETGGYESILGTSASTTKTQWRTLEEKGEHTHTMDFWSQSNGGGGGHSHTLPLPPHINTYMWKRIS